MNRQLPRKVDVNMLRISMQARARGKESILQCDLSPFSFGVPTRWLPVACTIGRHDESCSDTVAIEPCMGHTEICRLKIVISCAAVGYSLPEKS